MFNLNIMEDVLKHIEMELSKMIVNKLINQFVEEMELHI